MILGSLVGSICSLFVCLDSDRMAAGPLGAAKGVKELEQRSAEGEDDIGAVVLRCRLEDLYGLACALLGGRSWEVVGVYPLVSLVLRIADAGRLMPAIDGT